MEEEFFICYLVLYGVLFGIVWDLFSSKFNVGMLLINMSRLFYKGFFGYFLLF